MANKAKTSVRAKGYRKAEQKKPFLSRKEITWLVAIVAAIALAVVLFNVLYDDGSLKVSGGKIVVENFENSIVVDAAKGDAKRYFKLGEVGELDGFRRETEQNSGDENLKAFQFYPETKGVIESIRVSGGLGSALALAQNAYSNYGRLGYLVTPIQEVEIDGHKAYTLTSISAQSDQETGSTSVAQFFVAFVESAFEGHAVLISGKTSAKSDGEVDEAGITALVDETSVSAEEQTAYFNDVMAVLSLDKTK